VSSPFVHVLTRRPPPPSPLFPYTTLFRSALRRDRVDRPGRRRRAGGAGRLRHARPRRPGGGEGDLPPGGRRGRAARCAEGRGGRVGAAVRAAAVRGGHGLRRGRRGGERRGALTGVAGPAPLNGRERPGPRAAGRVRGPARSGSRPLPGPVDIPWVRWISAPKSLFSRPIWVRGVS